MDNVHFEYMDFEPDVDLFKEEIHFDILEDEAVEQVEYLISYAREHLKPSFGGIYLTVDDYKDLAEGASVTFGGKTLEGLPVAKLKGACHVAPYYVTCGTQLEDMDASSMDFMAPFWIDVLKRQSLFFARKKAFDYYREVLGSKVISSINPGSGNVGYWPVDHLKPLFELFDEYGCRTDVSLSPNMYMMPNKSVCGIFYASEKEIYTCSECRRQNCPSRRAPFAG